MYRIIIADDEPLIIRGLKKMMEWGKMDTEVVGEAEDGEQLLNLLDTLEPDIIISDISMPEKTGLDVLKEINKRKLKIKVIFLSGFQEFSYAKEAVTYGAVDYLLKPVSVEELENAINRAKDQIVQEQPEAVWKIEQQNVENVFKEINNFVHPEKVIVLFDEIDAVALDRTNANDLREMGRATSAMLKGMDYMDERVVMVATTNLFSHFDKALVRRFDSVIDFNRYTPKDLITIAEEFLNKFLSKFKLANKDIRLFRKIIMLLDPIPYPGELKNIIRTAVAFSDPGDSMDYLRRLYYTATNENPEDLKKLQEQKFTIREIEILTKIPRSTVARELKGIKDE